MAKPQNIIKKKAKAVEVKAPVQKRALKIRTSTRFYRNQTKKTVSKPKSLKSISSEVRRNEK